HHLQFADRVAFSTIHLIRMVRYFKAATATIPIVGSTADPVAVGLVDSFARPGGNITGVTSDAGEEIWGKRFALLRELIPAASRVGFLGLRALGGSVGEGASEMEARQAGISLIEPPLEGTIDGAEYRRVLKLMTQERADALIVSDQPELGTSSGPIIKL